MTMSVNHSDNRMNLFPIIDQKKVVRHLWRLQIFGVLIPIAWILGFDFIFPFLFLLIVPWQLRQLNIFEVLLIALAIWLKFSLIMSMPSDAGRIFSSLYSSFLLISLALVHAVCRIALFRVGLADISRFMLKSYGFLFKFSCVFVFLGVGAAFLSGQYLLNVPTLLGTFIHSLPGTADRSLVAEITRPDWGFGSFAVPRPLIFSPWYTAGAFTILCCGFFTIAALIIRGARFRNELMLDVFLFFMVLITLSRALIAFYIIAFVFSSILMRDKVRLLICFFGLLVGVFILTFMANLSGVSPIEFRGYSTDSRFEAYFRGISVAIEENLFWGNGYKPRDEDLLIPIGSHSSLISYLVRGGVVGLVLFLSVFYVLPMLNLVRAVKVIRRGSWRVRRVAAIFIRFQLMVWGWAIFQEIDTAAVAAFLLFFSLPLQWKILDACARHKI